MSPVRVASFNVENLGDDPRARPTLEQRLPVLRAQLEALRADVLCLQEVHAQKEEPHGMRQLRALRTLLHGTRYQDHALVCSVGPRGDGPQDHHNLVVVTRFPVGNFRSLYHAQVPAPQWQEVTATPRALAAHPVTFDRPVQHVTLQLPQGRVLHVFNVHLRAPLAAPIPGQKAAPFVWKSTPGWAEGFFLAAVKANAQALDVRLCVDAVLEQEPDALLVVAGDFNAGEREGPVRLLRADVDDTGNPALHQRVLHPVLERVPEAQRYSVLHGGAKRLLDHLLCSHALAPLVRGVEIHNAGLRDEAVDAEQPTVESHHAPVVADLAL